MKKRLIYLFIWAGIMSLSGCLEDKNNYDYSTLNELKGEITGMKEEYLLSFAEELTITPSFQFTIDEEAPDVSYEWYLDGKILPEEVNASCTFSFERGGVYEVTFSVVDNKSGVKFSRSCLLRVRSPFTRGWVVLSEGGGQESVLSFVGARSMTYKMAVTSPDDDSQTEIIDRDSLVYEQVVRDVLPGLGKNPTGLFLNAGYVGQGLPAELYEVSDEVGVMQDRWAELNGTTLERSVYTDQEFKGDFPEAGFHPQMIAMTYSAKAMLNSDGYIYWATNRFANDFHTCVYVSFPLGKDRKFTGVYPSYRVNKYHAAIPACTADNEIVGIMDDAIPESFENPVIEESDYSSNIYSVYEQQSGGEVDSRYQLGDWKIVTMLPATPPFDWDDYGQMTGRQEVNPGHLALLRKGADYELLYFHWGMPMFRRENRVYSIDYARYPIALQGYTDMAVFNNKQYVVIAEGSTLWYFKYEIDNHSVTLEKLHEFSSPVKALGANDINVDFFDSNLPASEWQPQHNGQLGVALEDGTFSIYEVLEVEKGREKVTINQLFPDPKAEAPMDNKFDKIVDIVYKYGSAEEFNSFSF